MKPTLFGMDLIVLNIFILTIFTMNLLYCISDALAILLFLVVGLTTIPNLGYILWRELKHEK